MSEKGGKGSKTSLKHSPSQYGSVGGKDNSSIKSKKTKKVQFDPQGKAEPNYKILHGSDDQFPTFAAKGEKGNKAAKANKGSLPKEPQPLELKTEKELPENAKCMMDCEAFQSLEGIKEQIAVLSEDPDVKIPISFDRGLEYVKNGTSYTNPQLVRQLLEPLKEHGVSEGEICMIANICPESVDEAFAFVSSMKCKNEKTSHPLQHALTKLSTLKRPKGI